ncbi:hypothetical protein GCM10025776_17110 [Corallincola platygyrae]
MQVSQQQCGKCQNNTPHFDATWSSYLYAPPIRSLISDFKFQRDLTTGKVLAELMAYNIQYRLTREPHMRPDRIIPIPLHPKKQRQRSFNQSQILAAAISRQTEIPLVANLCVRKKATKEQRSLSAKERRANMRAAFACLQDLEGQRIAMVDDVMTTGATCNALAQKLKSAGAKEVIVWCLARAPSPRG